ncbi:MAG TPA: sigma-54 dependent transcriptional regulator [Pyrinomonadaceae bacterium]|nr:sigma-54 dependent transcriptional regulator [Pyrinomonadaceae bacterium]
MKKDKVLVIDDDHSGRWALVAALRDWGYDVSEAETVAVGDSVYDSEHPSLVLLDIHLPDGSGLDLLENIKRKTAEAIVIMITGQLLAEDVITALRGGAYDFVTKPVNLDELEVTVRNALETGKLRKEVAEVRRELSRKFSFEQIIGESDSIRGVLDLANKVAASQVFSVLLQGDSGTGKDLVAKAMHYGSPRADKPFVAINCAAIPATLIESELFGYEKGAFTDAKAKKEGLFEQAEGGTLFLDEIGELELGLQAKLLRVLEEGVFRRVGGLKDIRLSVRVVAASNRDLRRECDAGRFRLDLYYRLSVIQIDIPPLRERGDDVLLLTDHFISVFNERLRRRMRGLAPEVAEVFRRYDWPGNVRELRNVIERAMILEDGDVITRKYLPTNLTDRSLAVEPSSSLPGMQIEGNVLHLPLEDLALKKLESSLIEWAFQKSAGNKSQAARLLGITRDQLIYRLKTMSDGSAS